MWLKRAGRFVLAWWRRELAREASRYRRVSPHHRPTVPVVPVVNHASFSDAVAAVEPLLAGVGVDLEEVRKDHHAGTIADSVRGQSKSIQMRISTEDRLVLLELAPLGYREPVRMFRFSKSRLTLIAPGSGICNPTYSREIEWLVGRGHGLVEVGNSSDAPRDIDLGLILRVVAADVQFVPKYVRSSGEMREELERQVSLLLEHCRPMLDGDFSAWPSVLEFAQTMWGPAQGETMEAWVPKAKQMMSDALEKNDYQVASQLWLCLRLRGVDLTPEEMEAGRMAAREIENMRRG
jgi:hypothetical protein